MKELRLKPIQVQTIGLDGQPKFEASPPGAVSFFDGETIVVIRPDSPLRIPEDLSETQAQAYLERSKRLELVDLEAPEVVTEPSNPTTPSPEAIPEDFPGAAALFAVGITTRQDLAGRLAGLDEAEAVAALTAVQGIGKSTAKKIWDALGN